MENEDARLEELSRLKDFSDLTSEERSFVLSAMGSKEAFEALRLSESVLMSTRKAEDLEPLPEHLARLHKRMQDVGQPEKMNWFMVFKVPALATLILMILSSWITWTLKPGRTHPDQNYPITTTIDTVYVDRVDTIFQERTVFRTVAMIQPCAEKKSQEAENRLSAPVGVSMKDNEELEKLLVSGSDR